MEAVRVPPSACRTSQSMLMVRSGKAVRSATDRMARPMRRWISWDRPLCRPDTASLGVRFEVAVGSIPYWAVIHPWPVPLMKWGTRSSTEALQRTRVFPNSMRHEPSG